MFLGKDLIFSVIQVLALLAMNPSNLCFNHILNWKSYYGPIPSILCNHDNLFQGRIWPNSSCDRKSGFRCLSPELCQLAFSSQYSRLKSPNSLLNSQLKKKTRNLEGWAIKKTKTELTFSINFLINKKTKQNKKTKN